MANLGLTESLRLSTQIQVNKVSTRVLGSLGDLLARLEHPKWWDDPYPLYEQIRAKGPLYRGMSGIWATTSFALCNQVLRDRRFGMKTAEGDMAPPLGLGEALLQKLPESFLDVDPPDHTRLRRLATPAFSPKRVESYRDRIQQTVDTMLDDLERRDRFDIALDLATPLPITVISDLLGIPEHERGSFAEYGATVGKALSGVESVREANDVLDVGHTLLALFERLVQERTEHPGDDVISTMAAALDDDKLTAQELYGAAMLLLIAGFETTVNLISNGVHALLTNPKQWQLLRDNPELAAGTVEEALRYDSPVQATARIAHTDVDLAGERIKKGQLVMLILAAGNRDSQAFGNPHQFDITRDGKPEHLAFSSGIHYCLGARLARIEGEIVFRSLAERMPDLRQAGPIVRRKSNAIRGLLEFPVTARAR